MVVSRLKIQNISIIGYECMYNQLRHKPDSFLNQDRASCSALPQRASFTKTELPEPLPPRTSRNGASCTNTHCVRPRTAPLRTPPPTYPLYNGHSTSTQLHAKHNFITIRNSNFVKPLTTNAISVGISVMGGMNE